MHICSILVLPPEMLKNWFCQNTFAGGCQSPAKVFWHSDFPSNGCSYMLIYAHIYSSEHSEMPISTLETRSRISSFQSHASRRDREFLPFSLMFRDEIENFFPSVSCSETRSRISVFTLVLRDETEKNVLKMHFCWEMASLIFKNIKFGQDCFLKLLLSLLSKCHFLTGHCVRRVKMKVASKGLVKTLIPSSEISCKTI